MVVIVGGFNKVLVGTFFGHCETSRKVRCWLYRDRGNKNIRNSIAAPRLCGPGHRSPGSAQTQTTDIFIWPEPRGAAASNQCLTPVNCGCSYIYIYIYIPAPAIINPSVHTADIAMSARWPVPAASSSTAHHILI